jgi:DNA replication protein DnaC
VVNATPKWLRAPDTYVSTRLSDVVPHSPAQGEALRRLTTWGEGVQRDGAKGLMLAGPPGVGKTMMVSALINTLSGPRGFVSAFDVESWLRDRMNHSNMASVTKADPSGMALEHARQWNELDYRLKMLRALPVLAIDDIGKEHHGASDWLVSEVHRLLRGRFMDGRPTILTTNIVPDKWDTDYGMPMASFIYEAYDVLTLAGTDYRRPRKLRTT